MTDKERLEEIKSRVWRERCTYAVGDDSSREGYRYILSDEDYHWLLEQAERAQELEQQNKRYREALEFYADEKSWMNRKVTILMDGEPTDVEDCPAIFDDGGNIARQALEGKK